MSIPLAGKQHRTAQAHRQLLSAGTGLLCVVVVPAGITGLASQLIVHSSVRLPADAAEDTEHLPPPMDPKSPRAILHDANDHTVEAMYVLSWAPAVLPRAVGRT